MKVFGTFLFVELLHAITEYYLFLVCRKRACRKEQMQPRKGMQPRTNEAPYEWSPILNYGRNKENARYFVIAPWMRPFFSYKRVGFMKIG